MAPQGEKQFSFDRRTGGFLYVFNSGRVVSNAAVFYSESPGQRITVPYLRCSRRTGIRQLEEDGFSGMQALQAAKRRSGTKFLGSEATFTGIKTGSREVKG